MKAGVTKDLLQTVMDSKRNHKAKQIVGLLSGNTKILSVPEDSVTQWEMFYEEVIGFKVDLSKIKVKNNKSGFSQPIIIAKDTSYLDVSKLCDQLLAGKETLNSCRIENIERSKNRRTSDETYVVYIRDDFSLKSFRGMSREEVSSQSEFSTTMLEYLILKLFYWWFTNGKLLDCNETRCEVLCLATEHTDYPNESIWYFDGIMNRKNGFGYCGYSHNVTLSRYFYREISY